MSKSAAIIETEAVALTRDARVRLAVRLIDSLEERQQSSDELQEAWVKEALRRYQDYVRGQDIAIPAEAVFEEFKDDNDENSQVSGSRPR